MVSTIPITEARNSLGQIVKRVTRNKEYFILEKDGIPVLGVMSADELEDYLELQDKKVQQQIERNYQEYLAGKSRPATELLAEIRGEKRSDVRKRKKI
jgi:PHD/YefM family antitoxin component YafN of YafNO toxin-antitoxin module